MKTILSAKYIIFGLIILFGVSSFTACTSDSKELISNPEQTVKMEISAIKPLLQGDASVSITNYRLIIAERNSEYILLNQSTLENNLVMSLANQIQIEIKPGFYTAYLIANETSVMTPTLQSAKFLKTIKELILEPMSWNELTEINIPLMAINQIQIRAKDNTTNAGEVSDNGGAWRSNYEALLERIFAKVSLSLNKNTSNPVIIESVKIRQIAKTCYLGKYIYDNPQTLDISISGGLPKSLNNDYQSIFDNRIISERLFTDITNSTKSSFVEINARFNNIPIQYIVPLGEQSGSNYIDYQIKRNNHYFIKGSISQINDFNNYFFISVLPWNKETSNIDFNNNITYELSWDDNTSFINNQIMIGSSDIAECEFTLLTPRGKRWTATLSNGIDFEFDYNEEGVSQGISGIDDSRSSKIRVKAKRKMSTGSSTNLFIYLEDGRQIPINPTNTNAINAYSIILKAE